MLFRKAIAMSLALSSAMGGAAMGEARQQATAGNPYGMCMPGYAGPRRMMQPQAVDLLAPTGVGFVRAPLYFRLTRPDSTTWDFSRFDESLATLEKGGFRPLCTLSYGGIPTAKSTRRWAWPAEEHLAEWGEFAARAAERYRGRVRHWEIWNEPNIPGFWRNPNPVNYWKVLDAAYRAIKAVDPEAVVTTAGFAGTPLDFVEELCRHDTCFDAVVIHPYCDHGILNRPEDKIDNDIDGLRELLSRYGKKDVPVWITEIGWPTERDTPQTEGMRWPAKPLVDALEKARPKGRRMVVVSVEADSGKVDPGFVSLAQTTFGDRVEAVGCAPADVGARLDAGEADILFWSFGYGYFDIDVDAVERFLAQGGTVIVCGGTPLCCPYPRNEKGRFYRVPKSVEDYGNALSRRLRFHAPNLTWKKPVPKGLKLDGANLPHRYLTGDRLGPGDEFIPVLEATDDTGRKFPVTAVYRFGGGKKGNLIVSCVNNRFWHSVSEERQAKLLARTYGVMTAKNIEKMFWYTFVLSEATEWHSQDHFSIVHRDFSPKPAFGALKAFLAMRPAGSAQRAGAWHGEDKVDYFPQWTMPDGTHAGMIWTLGFARTAEFEFDSDKVEFFELFGKPLDVKRGRQGWLLPLSDSPIYFKGGHVKPQADRGCGRDLPIPELSAIGGTVSVSDGAFEYVRTDPGEGPSGFSAVWRFSHWEKDAWIFMPACAYGGNREWTGIPLGDPVYPPGPTPAGLGPDPRLEMSETVPALAPDGSGVMEVTAGDMPVPCAGVFFPEARCGTLIFTEAQVKGEQVGYSVKAGEIKVDYPARRSSGYRFNRRSEPTPDRLPTLRSGERICSRFRRMDFAATNITDFLEHFFRARKCVMSSRRTANGYTSDLWRETESCWNEKLFVDGAYCQERFKWVPGWSAGPQCVYPLYRLGCDPRTKERCRATLDFMCAHQTEAGVFVGCLVGTGKMRPPRTNRQAGDELTQFFRMHADGVWNLLKCIEVVGDDEKWLRAAERGADALVAVWRRYGQFGQWVDSKTLELIVGRSDACAIAPAALAAAYRKFGKREYLDVACAACDDYCRRDLERGRTYGGMADAVMAPDSESAISLLESCMALYEATGDGKWLCRAKACAALVSTWVMTYAYDFPKTSELGRRGVNTTGSVFANVQNKHAAPGFATLSGQGLLKLHRATGDAAYLELLADVVSFLPQMVSRADRPLLTNDGHALDAGFMCERVNTSDWEGKGNIGRRIFYASCWCGTSLLATWNDVVGEPEVAQVLFKGR